MKSEIVKGMAATKKFLKNRRKFPRIKNIDNTRTETGSFDPRKISWSVWNLFALSPVEA
jgi:hypothetical protein